MDAHGCVRVHPKVTVFRPVVSTMDVSNGLGRSIYSGLHVRKVRDQFWEPKTNNVDGCRTNFRSPACIVDDCNQIFKICRVPQRRKALVRVDFSEKHNETSALDSFRERNDEAALMNKKKFVCSISKKRNLLVKRKSRCLDY